MKLMQRINNRLHRGVLKLLRYDTDLVAPRWYVSIKLALMFSTKIKVGFGPITSCERDLAERKWRMDPIINAINSRKKCRYRAGFFINPAEMAAFDVIVIVKKFTHADIPLLQDLKNQGKKVIYDIVDNPNAEKKYGTYFAACPEFSQLMDGFILSSPLHEREAKRFSTNLCLIEHPIISALHKTVFTPRDELIILAHGYYENLKNIRLLEPLIQKITEDTGKKITLVYHSEVKLSDSAGVKYVKWQVDNCFTEIINADFAIVVRGLHLRHQRSKPSTKLITFMAAGVPVICTPTQADRRVMQHRVTGLFADTMNDWERYLRLLVTNSAYRKQLGRAARSHVLPRYSVTAITDKYVAFFDHVKKATHEK